MGRRWGHGRGGTTDCKVIRRMEPNYFTKESDHLKRKKNELLIVLLAFAVVFIARLQFRQTSFWEWDELLFASSIHKYDLPSHSPHPPSYFLWVALIRLFYKIFGSELNAQVFTNVLFGSLAVFPLYYIFRSVASAKLALAGTLIYMFNPVVWVEGENAFNDTTAFFWFALALAVLMRAEKNLYFYLGCFLLGVALGVRVQNMFLGALMLIPLWQKLRQRDFKAAIVGVAILVFTCLAWLIPTAIYGAGGIKAYISFINAETHRTMVEDSWGVSLELIFNRAKWALKEMLVIIWGGRYLAILFNLLALAGLASYIIKKKWWELLILSVCFLPYFVFAFLFPPLWYLKYTVPYIPFFCFFISVGAYELASKLGRFKNPVFAAGIAVILLACTTKAYPAVKILHEEKSPVMQAIAYIQNNFSLDRNIIYYDPEFYPFAQRYLRNFKTDCLLDESRTEELPPQPGMDAVVLTAYYPELNSTWNLNFKQTSGALRLLGIGRQLGPFQNVWINKADIIYIDFIPRSERTSRWMGERGLCYLRNKDSSEKVLSLKAYVPVSLFQQAPTISIYLNDQLLEEFPQETEEMVKEFSIPGEGLEANAWSKLEIKIDQTFNPATSDFAGEADRDVSLILEDLAWADATGGAL